MAKVTINGYEVELSIAELQQLVGTPNTNGHKREVPVAPRKPRGIRTGSVEELVLFTMRELAGGEMDKSNGEFSVGFLTHWLSGYCDGVQVQNGMNRLNRKKRLVRTKRGHYRLPERKNKG
jgi:hypothetical protein